MWRLWPGPSGWSRRIPAGVAILLVLLGVVATAAGLDAPSDGSVVPLGWRADGVVVNVPGTPADGGIPVGVPGAPVSAPGASGGVGLRTGDLVTGVAGHRLADGLGLVPRPRPGTTLVYDVVRERPTTVTVRVGRPDPYPLLMEGWGDLVFVLTLAGLAVALYLRRPEEPATAPLLVLAAGLLGSTLTVTAGLPVLALATGGAQLWLFHLNTVVAYSISWGGLLAFTIAFTAPRPLPARSRRAMAFAYAAPPAAMALWSALAAPLVPNALGWLGLVHGGQTAVVAAVLVTSTVWGLAAYRRNPDPLMRARMRWLVAGGAVATLLSLAGWHLPELLAAARPLPPGALGLSGLPFVAGIGVALRRHRLFDIERLANRSLVYASVVAILVAGYAAVVALLVSGLGLSQPVAAALTAAGAALALAPLRALAQSTVNRVMYGDRRDPSAALTRLGTRLQAVLLPADVLPAIVETVARSLRVPHAAIDLVDGSGAGHLATQYGVPVGEVHVEPLRYHGTLIGHLRVSARGSDDPLDPVDLGLIASLAQQVGTAVQAVRLHDDLVRSRAEVVASREDERRRLRRDLHDGLGPTLAAIRIKAGLAARDVPAGSAARPLLDEISAEAAASLTDVRRLVEALRPPALDELGVVGAIRARAAALSGAMSIEVVGAEPLPALPAAVETAAYRIAVEAITNAVRHSEATHCTATVTPSDGGVEVTVRDNGRGLDPDRTAGVGIRSMRERAAEVGGAWSMRSPPGGGTHIRAFLPTSLGGDHDQGDPRR
ncbi:GAF domain-containing sensor histidine kinase [Nonomuraea sp. NPDC051941]|uniref:GAF domain-containing sensor histidine kinase n=1 Tax=Nonomuraea sp. NPDC051941 TaxID=3364373 RepID=UPI0037C8EEB0